MDKIKELKAEAYDCIAALEQAKARLQQINAEIAQLLQAPKEE